MVLFNKTQLVSYVACPNLLLSKDTFSGMMPLIKQSSKKDVLDGQTVPNPSEGHIMGGLGFLPQI